MRLQELTEGMDIPPLVPVPADHVLTRAFYLVLHQDDARVARINRMADTLVDHMRAALSEAVAAEG